LISYIKGTLASKNPTGIIVEAGGIGYEILVPLSSYDRLGDLGSEVEVYTHFHVREDAHILFGFATTAERRLFQFLIGISGVGPRMALSVLSGVGVDDFCEAIVQEEVDFLTSIPGVGKKTAQRLIVELKSRLSEEDVRVAVGGGRVGRGNRVSQAVQALVALGFSSPEARKAVDRCIDESGEDVDVEELIRGALKNT
jgi:Holliday junction DNA helicase RuvA